MFSRIKSAVHGLLSRPPAGKKIQAHREQAMTTPDNRGQWQYADGLSADSSLDPGTRRILRNRARYEAQNDSYCSGMLETLADDTIGEGPLLQVQTPSKEVNSIVESRFWEWAVAVDLAQKLWTMRYAEACDGEAFATLFTNRALQTPVKLDFRLHEAEQIADPSSGLNGSRETDGIILDDFGNVIGYTLLTEHPGSAFGGMLQHVTVPARAVIHLFKPTRPGQHRGTPEIEPALRTFNRRRSYLKAVGQSAESAASVSWLVETDNPPGAETDSDERTDDFDVLETVHGKGLVLPSGARMSQLKAEQPTSTADMLNRIFIAEQARCIGQPYNIAANDSSGYNFSSAQLDHRQYFKRIGRKRVMSIEPKALDKLFAAWWEEARLIPNYLPPQARQEMPSHAWRWNSAGLIDQLKEAQAAEILLRNGLLSLANHYAREGKDWEAELQQIAREQEFKGDLGLSFGQPAAQPQPGQSDDAEEADDDTPQDQQQEENENE